MMQIILVLHKINHKGVSHTILHKPFYPLSWLSNLKVDLTLSYEKKQQHTEAPMGNVGTFPQNHMISWARDWKGRVKEREFYYW